MRFPQNIILNGNKINNYSVYNYWVSLYLNNLHDETQLTLKLLKFKNSKFNLVNKLKLNNNFKNKYLILKSDFSWDFFNIFFLKREKMYTKLKYSRVTQFDISSGAVAALFAGFIGFLISEKFGFELIDSGDFYFFFMYLVFLIFSLKLILRINNIEGMDYNIFSIKWILVFLNELYYLFLNRFLLSFVFLSTS